jgi:hypothetical protein
MSKALARLQDRADVPEDVRAQVGGDWADAWPRVEAERLLPYAAEGAL